MSLLLVLQEDHSAVIVSLGKYSGNNVLDFSLWLLCFNKRPFGAVH